MTLVKICGLTDEEDARNALLLGANFIGFLIEVGISKDSLTVKEAKEIFSCLPRNSRTVYVTHETTAEPIISIAKIVKPHAIQLHNTIPKDKIKQIKKELPNVKIIKAIHVENEESIKEAKKFEDIADYILLDSKVGNALGGTGATHDWKISARIAKEVKKPVILAGGLNPNNINQAIAAVNPFCVDTNSGVKSEKNPRRKDYEKMENFIRLASDFIE